MKKIILSSLGLICMTLIWVGYVATSKPTMVGTYIRSGADTHLIIAENNCPIVMSNQMDKEDLFEDLKSGDTIKIAFDTIEETYPGGTGVYSCKLMRRGQIEDVPQHIIKGLKEMGWYFE